MGSALALRRAGRLPSAKGQAALPDDLLLLPFIIRRQNRAQVLQWFLHQEAVIAEEEAEEMAPAPALRRAGRPRGAKGAAAAPAPPQTPAAKLRPGRSAPYGCSM